MAYRYIEHPYTDHNNFEPFNSDLLFICIFLLITKMENDGDEATSIAEEQRKLGE